MERGLSWKEKLGAKIPVELGREIDIFEQQMELRKQGKIDEKVFAETRLRRAIVLWSRSPRLHGGLFNLAMVLHSAGRDAEADRGPVHADRR